MVSNHHLLSFYTATLPLNGGAALNLYSSDRTDHLAADMLQKGQEPELRNKQSTQQGNWHDSSRGVSSINLKSSVSLAGAGVVCPISASEMFTPGRYTPGTTA